MFISCLEAEVEMEHYKTPYCWQEMCQQVSIQLQLIEAPIPRSSYLSQSVFQIVDLYWNPCELCKYIK